MLLLGLGGAFVAYLTLHRIDPDANRLDLAKTALAVVAGSGAGAGLYVAYRRQRTAEANIMIAHTNSAREQSNSDRELDKLFTERYGRAVEQLGHDNPAIRLGGVTALARIAQDSSRDQDTCLKLLCTYVRMSSVRYPEDDLAEREVRSTALGEIALQLRRNGTPRAWRRPRIDLRGTRIHDLDFSRCVIENAEFDGAVFTGKTRFNEAVFDGPVWFTGCVFEGPVRFKGAQFGSHAGFGGARFDPDTSFAGAVFNPSKPPVWPDDFPEPGDIHLGVPTGVRSER
jgi:hypothetical protein